MDMGIRADGGTHPGKMRQHNEDAFYLTQPNGTVDPALVARAGYLFVVADGVGGNRGGARASEMAVSRLPAAYYGLTNGDPLHNLRQAFDGVAREIVAEAVANPERSNMSCTVVAAVVRDNVATIAHLGDARAYLLRGGVLQPLTSDHTWVQMQVEKGTLTPAEAENHPERNVITKSMGNPALPEPSLRQVALQEGDRLLLCSDGLCGVAGDPEMAAVLNRAADPTAAIKPLIDLANRKGGPDNVTAVVVQTGRAGAVAAAGGRKGNSIVPFLLIALAAVLVGAFFYFRPGGGTGPLPTVAATAEGTLMAVVVETLEPADAARATSTAAAVVAQATGTITATATLETAAGVSDTPVAVLVAPTSAPVVPLTIAIVEPFQAGCPPPDNSPEYRRNDTINFRWQSSGAPAAGPSFRLSVGPLGGERVNYFDATQASNNEWSRAVSVADFRRDGVSDYEWQVLYVSGGQETAGLLSCFRVTGGGGGGQQPEPTDTIAPPTKAPTEIPPPPTSTEPPPPPTSTPDPDQTPVSTQPAP